MHKKSFSFQTEKEMLARKRKVMSTYVLVLIIVFAFYFLASYGLMTFIDPGKELLNAAITNEKTAMEQRISGCENAMQKLEEQFSKETFSYITKEDYEVLSNASVPVFVERIGLLNMEGVLSFDEDQNYLLDDESVLADLQANRLIMRSVCFQGNVKMNVLAVPYTENGNCYGAIVGIISDRLIDDSLLIHLKNQQSGLVLLDKNQRFLASEESFNFGNSELSGFIRQSYLFGKSANAIIDDIEMHKGADIKLRYRSVTLQMIVMDFPVDEGIMICFLPISMLNGVTKSIIICLGILTLLLIVFFSIAGFAISTVFNRLAKKCYEVDKYETLALIEKKVIVDYNFTNSRLRLSGCADSVFGIEPAHYDWAQPYELFEKVHPDDLSIRESLSKSIAKGEERFVAEFRVSDDNQNYTWHRVSCSILRDEDHTALRLVGEIANTDEELDKAREFKQQAETDLLTGLLNKISIEKNVDEYIAEHKNDMYAFFIIDLDNFKSVNDNLGHAKGDEVLKEVALKLMRIFSVHDFIGRIGGDEFTVVLNIPEAMINNAAALIEQKANSVNKELAKTYRKGQMKIAVSASVGISTYPTAGACFSQLYKMADKALYYSKENGKNRYTIYSESL